jgi:hypothetical protein
MNPNEQAWQRLAKAARLVPPDNRDEGAPYGFAARVAARAMSAERRPAPIFEHFSLKLSLQVMSVSCLLAVAAVGVGYPSVAKLFSDQAPPAIASSPEISPAGPSSMAMPAVSSKPSEAPAVNSSPSDDPVADLVGIVS